MERQYIRLAKAEAEISAFRPGEGVAEYQVMIHVLERQDTYEEQLGALMDAYRELREGVLQGTVAAFMRFFLSDAANQADYVLATATEQLDCALSVVEQPPLDGSKVALWVYLLTGMQTRVQPGGLYSLTHGAYTHYWGGSAFNRAVNSEYQARLLLNDYVMQLMEQGCTLADNCLRTWFFVQNIDVNYAGVEGAQRSVCHPKSDRTHPLHSQYGHCRATCRPKGVCPARYVCGEGTEAGTGALPVCAGLSESYV